MTKSTAVAVQEPAELSAEAAALEAELVGANQKEVDASDIQIPLLKVGQSLTDEVQQGDADQGEFINSLTREGLGTQIEFIVASYQKGRFFHGDRKKNRRARKAYGTNIVPWTEDPFYGKPFDEHPDAEEQYSARANAGEIEWGSGPSISTTYDFTGYVVSQTDEDGNSTPIEEPIPVCLSLMRSNSKAAKKWATLLQAVLRGQFWGSIFVLTTEKTQSAAGPHYIVSVKQGRKPTAAERTKALELASVVRKQVVSVVGEDDNAAPKAEPASAGGLEV